MRVRLSLKQCAKRAGVSKRTVKRWGANPKIGYPQTHNVNGRDFIYFDELEPWEAANPDFYPVKEEIDD